MMTTTRHLLADKTPVRVRVFAPEDRALVVEAFQKLSADTRYYRFGTAQKSLYEDFLKRVLKPKPGLHESWGVIRLGENDDELLGAASFSRKTRRSKHAEISFTIADAMQHCGLATLLLARLWTRAESLKIRAFTGTILFDNYRTLAWFRRLGAELTFHGSTYDFILPISEESLKPSTATLQLKDRLEEFRRFNDRRRWWAYWRD